MPVNVVKLFIINGSNKINDLCGMSSGKSGDRDWTCGMDDGDVEWMMAVFEHW